MLLIVFEGRSETGLLSQAKWVFEGLWVSGWEVGRLHGFKYSYTSAIWSPWQFWVGEALNAFLLPSASVHL